MALPDDLTPPAPPPGDGEMSGGWKATVTLTWIGVVIGLASVWAVSRQVGLSTWWLGPPANGRHPVINLAPFVAPSLALILAIGGSHRTWKVGILAGAAIMLIGAVDLGRVTRLGVVEIVLGLAGAGSSLASWIGTPRATSP